MSHAAKHFDPQLGIDIHTYLLPFVPLPVPLPTPHIGLVFDPFDYIPFIGGTIDINGVKRATAGTGGLAVHIPIFGMWMPQVRMPMGPQFMDDELFMGSMTVVADGDPMSRIGMPVLDCNVFGLIPPFRIKKPKKPHFSMSLPTSINLAIPNGVTVGGPPMISIMGMAFKGAFAGLGALRRSKLGQRAADALKNAKRAVFKNLPSGFLKCKVLRAEPVDIRSGSVVVAHEDFAIPGRLPLAWPREYRSDNPYSGACGHGWETPADVRLEIDTDGYVLLHEPGAGAAVFPALPSAPGPAHAVLELVDGARLVWVRGAEGGRGADELQVHLKGDRIYAFDHPGANVTPVHGPLRLPIQRIADLCGNDWRFERSAQAGGTRLLRIVESGTFEIDEAGRRNELAGRYIDVHAPYGQLQKLTLHDPGTGLNHPLVAYQYDAEGDLIAALDPLDAARTFGYDRHHLVRHTDRNGLSFYYAYNAAWQVEHAWGDGGLHDYHFRYDELLRETEVIDSLGHSSLVKFDENRLPLCEIDALNGVTVFEYDEVGRTTAIVDAIGARTEFGYDEWGNLTRMLGADGAEQRVEYDPQGRPLVAIDPLKARIEQQWSESGLLLRRTEPLGATTRYEYGPHGELSAMVDARGARTVVRHDRHGHLQRWTDPLGQTRHFSHDVLGRLQRQVDPAGSITRYEHDAKGRLLRTELPGGGITHREYDAEDRLVRHVDARGAEDRLSYTGLASLACHVRPTGHTLRYHHDSEEQLVAVENERGERFEIKRDALGRIAEEVDYWGQATRFQHDAAGRLLSRTDPLGRRVGFETDLLGRITRRTLPDPASRSGQGDETFRYDLAGRLTEMRNSVSHVTRRFDAAGQLVEERQNGFAVEHRYDEAGNRILRRSGAGHQVAFEYDLLGRAVGVRIDDEAPVIVERDAVGRVVAEQLSPQLRRTLGYDQRGLLSVQAVHDLQGPLFQTTFEHDVEGNLVRRTDSTWGTDRFRYDPMGRLLEHVDTDGKLAAWSLDPVGDRLRTRLRASEARRVVGGAAPHAVEWSREGESDGFEFVYDRAGNLTHRTSLREPGQPMLHLVWDANQRLASSRWRGGLRDGQTTLYGYDPTGRRVFKRNPEQTTWFFWDGDVLLGEVTSPNDASPDTTSSVSGARVYDLASERQRLAALKALHRRAREYVCWPASHEPLAMVEGAPGSEGCAGGPLAAAPGAPAAASSPDVPHPPPQRLPGRHSPALAAGSLGQLGLAGLGVPAPSDIAGPIAAMAASAGTLTSQGLALGTLSLQPSPAIAAGPVAPPAPRTRPAVPAATPNAASQARSVAPATTAAAATPSRARRLPRSVTIAFFHNDVNGAPVRVTDAAGSLLWAARPRASGEVTEVQVEETTNPIRLQGQYADIETGLHYNRYRYYDPVAGMYVSQDPLGLAPSSNLYGYGCNTTGWIDPLGLESACAAATEQRRNKLGQFMPKNGDEIVPGSLAEQEVWDAIRKKPGWNVIEGRVYAKNADGKVRVYDGVAVSPRGTVIGLEVKSGSARKTAAQREFDKGVSGKQPVTGTGRNTGLQVTRTLLINRP